MRILGITIPDNKRLEIGLTTIYGVGRPMAKEVLDNASVEYGKKPKDITPDEENKIRKFVEELKVEGDLKREVAGNIKRLKDVMCYRGTRHIKRLPLRGQRTKTNSRTTRGRARRTMGSGRTKVDKK